jgi:hypothetical protein
MKDFEKVTDELLGVDMTLEVDSIIESFQRLLKKRDEVIEAIESRESKEKVETEDLNRIVAKNLAVETKFSEVMLLIENNLSGIKKEKTLSSLKKKANRGYMNVGRQNDGYFIDKKK